MHSGNALFTPHRSSRRSASTIRRTAPSTATIFKAQQTVTEAGEETSLTARGRHDPCVLPRAVPMVEAMPALIRCDHWLRQRGQNG